MPPPVQRSRARICRAAALVMVAHLLPALLAQTTRPGLTSKPASTTGPFAATRPEGSDDRQLGPLKLSSIGHISLTEAQRILNPTFGAPVRAYERINDGIPDAEDDDKLFGALLRDNSYWYENIFLEWHGAKVRRLCLQVHGVTEAVTKVVLIVDKNDQLGGRLGDAYGTPATTTYERNDGSGAESTVLTWDAGPRQIRLARTTDSDSLKIVLFEPDEYLDRFQKVTHSGRNIVSAKDAVRFQKLFEREDFWDFAKTWTPRSVESQLGPPTMIQTDRESPSRKDCVYAVIFIDEAGLSSLACFEVQFTDGEFRGGGGYGEPGWIRLK
ncbi:MAG: hypothetical protein AB1601_03750 [Planctomycetota bacterium]